METFKPGFDSSEQPLETEQSAAPSVENQTGLEVDRELLQKATDSLEASGYVLINQDGRSGQYEARHFQSHANNQLTFFLHSDGSLDWRDNRIGIPGEARRMQDQLRSFIDDTGINIETIHLFDKNNTPISWDEFWEATDPELPPYTPDHRDASAGATRRLDD